MSRRVWTDADRAYRRRWRDENRELFREQQRRWNLRRERKSPRRGARQRARCHHCGRSVAVTKIGLFWKHYANPGEWCRGSGDGPLGWKDAVA